MSLLQIDHYPPRRRLNGFGLIWMAFFGIAGGVAWYGGGTAWVPMAIWTAAIGVPLLGWWMPGFMRVVYLGMTYASFPVGFVVSWSLLAAVFYLVLTPIGLVMRLFGYDPMDRRFDRRATSYWAPRKPSGDVERYFQQF